jgi:hypothetical protein
LLTNYMELQVVSWFVCISKTSCIGYYFYFHIKYGNLDTGDVLLTWTIAFSVIWNIQSSYLLLL